MFLVFNVTFSVQCKCETILVNIFSINNFTTDAQSIQYGTGGLNFKIYNKFCIWNFFATI